MNKSFLMLIGEGISAMIKLRYKNENWMDDRQPDTLDIPAIDALTKEIRSKYNDMFDSVSVRANEIVMHLDNADAELHITTSGTYCESYLVVNLTNKRIETSRDVQRFVDDTIRSVDDIVD